MRRDSTRALLILALALALPSGALAQEGFGGSRDIGLARHQARRGHVPSAQSFSAEGMLSEHHFPVQESRCPEAMCVFAAVGHGLHRASLERSGYLLLEPVSGIEPSEHHRAPLNVGLVIDISGSMSGDKLGWAKQSAHALIEQLGPADRISIVTFGSTPQVVLAPQAATDRRALHDVVEAIANGGSTNLHDGLAVGFEAVDRAHDEARQDQVFLFTDERPNTGVTDEGSFLELVGRYAEQGVALTVVGVGLDLGVELARSMSQLEGGSTFYVGQAGDVDSLFGEAFDQRVTPVARSLALTVHPGPGLRVAEVFGVPEEQVSRASDGSVTLRAATLFLDARRSGAIVRLAPTHGDEAALTASARVEYRYVRGSDGAQVSGELSAQHRATREDSLAEFDAISHYRAYALANFAELLRASLTHWGHGREEEARRILTNARHALDIDVAVTDDPELARERELADSILTNMQPERSRPGAEYAAVEYRIH